MNQESPPAAAEGHESGIVLQRPWSFVPTMALFQTLTYCVISILPGLFLKSLGASNEEVGLASLFALPIRSPRQHARVVDWYADPLDCDGGGRSDLGVN